MVAYNIVDYIVYYPKTDYLNFGSSEQKYPENIYDSVSGISLLQVYCFYFHLY